jgi:hypothetical protein
MSNHSVLRGIAASAAALAVFAGSAAPAQAPAPIKLERIRVQLIYETTGTLSPDIAPPADFTLWNTIIGEGSAAEPASDVLVGVELRTADDQANATIPLKIVVRDEDGKVLATRTFEAVFLDQHRAVRSLLVPNATCAGPVMIEASFGTQKLRTPMDFACGE